MTSAQSYTGTRLGHARCRAALSLSVMSLIAAHRTLTELPRQPGSLCVEGRYQLLAGRICACGI